MVWSIVPIERVGDERWTLFGGLEVGDDARLSIAELASDSDFIAPPEYLWLVGADRTCHAKVGGRARIAIHEDGELEATIAFELRGCDGTAWAPVGLVAHESQAADLRWHPATRRSPGEAHALARLHAELTAQVEAAHPGDDHRQIRVELSAVETTPRIVEAVYGALWVATDPCEGGEALRSTIGALQPGSIDPLPCPQILDGDCSGLWLQGALGRDGSPEIIVLMDERHDANVVIRSNARGVYTQGERDGIVPIPTTSVHDEDRIERHFEGAESCDDDL